MNVTCQFTVQEDEPSSVACCTPANVVSAVHNVITVKNWQVLNSL